MRYIGMDLAWGPNGTTGLAALDDDGVLLDVGDANTDDQIIEWVGEWAPEECLVAIDAPLIVRNAFGQRGCERLIGRYFGKYNAYCHSSNLSNVHFATGTRGLRIADALSLDVDLASEKPRRAVEVYPHPAIVSLFNLEAVLRYKNKPGRTLDFLRQETIRLLDFIEGLESATVPLHVRNHPDWTRIRETVDSASGKSTLAKVEDSIDAVVCAYIAMVAELAADSVRVIGDNENGYILTPVLPEVSERIDQDLADGFTLPVLAERTLRRAPAKRPPVSTLYVVMTRDKEQQPQAVGPFADRDSAIAWANQHGRDIEPEVARVVDPESLREGATPDSHT